MQSTISNSAVGAFVRLIFCGKRFQRATFFFTEPPHFAARSRGSTGAPRPHRTVECSSLVNIGTIGMALFVSLYLSLSLSPSLSATVHGDQDLTALIRACLFLFLVRPIFCFCFCAWCLRPKKARPA